MKKFVLFIFSLFACVCCIASVARSLSNSPVDNDYPFTELVQYMSEAPVIDANPEFIDFSISDDWGAFNFLKIFINTSVGIVNFLVYLAQCVANVVIYIVYFLRYIFLGSDSVNIGNVPSGGGGSGHLGGR